MIFESWVTDTYTSTSLHFAVKRHSAQGSLKKYHKALHMADSMVLGETVVDLAVGKFGSFGDSLLVITNERVLILRNTFNSGQTVSLDLRALDKAELSYIPILGYALTIGGYKLSRISAHFAATLRMLLTAQLADHWAVAA